MPTLTEDATYLAKMFASVVAIGSAAAISLPFLLPTAFLFSPLIAIFAAYTYIKPRAFQRKLLQGPSSTAARRPWQPSPDVQGKHYEQEEVFRRLPEPALTGKEARSGLPPVSKTACGLRDPSSRTAGFGATQAGERTNVDAACRFPSQTTVPQADIPQTGVPPTAIPPAGPPHVAPTPPAGIRAVPSSPESVLVAGFPKARAVAGLGSMEGPTGLGGPRLRVRAQAAGHGGIEEGPAEERHAGVGEFERGEQQEQEGKKQLVEEEEEEGEEEQEGPTLVLHHIPKDLTGVARVREGEAAEAGVEAPAAEETTAADFARQELGKPEGEAEEKRVVGEQGAEESEEGLLVEKEVEEEGARVASELKKLEKVITGRTIQAPASPREEAELLCGLVGVTPPPPLSPAPKLPPLARVSRKQAAEGQLWEVRRANQLVEATKEQLGVA
ncbi:hypothetical protein CLOM_g15230 [Closterium sp. NIES-68]|nr:hypothetical protein CLOM_g15230 [Closterium sp. NIES-68]GJP75952.1 hypothetical protein CLOP_g6350 [Closterium sp. NIES-67]